MLWLLLESVAFAQDSASSMPDTGTMLGGGALAYMVVSQLFGLVKTLIEQRNEKSEPKQEPPTPQPPAENAAIAALDVRLKSVETAVKDLRQRADDAKVQRTEHKERIDSLRRDHDGHVAAVREARTADRNEVSDRFDRLADRLDPRR